MPTSPFLAFEAPDPASSTTPETLAFGLALGAALGATLPVLTFAAEWAASPDFATVLRNPSPAVWISLLAPVVSGLIGAWSYRVLAAQRSAYDSVARKAASLLDETWDLRATLDLVADGATIAANAPPVRGERRMELAPDGPWGRRTIDAAPEPRSASRPVAVTAVADVEALVEAEALVSAQEQLLHSVGSATRDGARRMQISLYGLQHTRLTAGQTRLVEALHGHLAGLWDLADDVVSYANGDDAGGPSQGAPAGRVRAAA